MALTMGDGAGVGPEIIVKALADREVYRQVRPLVIGDLKVLARARSFVSGVTPDLRSCRNPGEAHYLPGTIDVIDLDNLTADLIPGQVQARAGKAAYEYIAKAVELALAGQVDAVCTAPLNKEALHLAGYSFPGHTEILAHLSGTSDYAMLLAGGPLRVIHVTTHVGLQEACNRITTSRVLTVIKLAHQVLVKVLPQTPRIAVAGLNPHAGEGGLFGREEIEAIIPAVLEAQAMGYEVTGPVPPDTVFWKAVQGQYDIVVAMYHDQGHIPVKLLGFETGVNVTVGLPFIRTSVDHGTAFDIAGTGQADPRSLLEALKLAGQLTGK